MDESIKDEILEKTILPQKRGRITIPVEFRSALGIDENTPLHLKLLEDGIVIKVTSGVDQDGLLRDYNREEVLAFLQRERLDVKDFESIVKTIQVWPNPGPIPRLFLDASVLLAALDFETNYSRLILELCRYGKARALLTEVVIREAEQAVKVLMDDEMLARFYAMLTEIEPEIIPLPRTEVLQMVDRVVMTGYSHLLSSAWAGGANYILSLDRNSFLIPEKREIALPSITLTPREFILQEVPI